ncbi:MAG: flagellar motor protein MotB [Paracoccaceae bacterium]
MKSLAISSISKVLTILNVNPLKEILRLPLPLGEIGGETMTDFVKNVASKTRHQINIKRKKIVKVQEGHTGAWKVAYADFVTAMMAFFMLMWLMNATTEKQKTGLADYFSPTSSINKSVSGGDNHFKGATIFKSLKLAKTGTGQSHAYESTSKTNGTEGHPRKESDAENKNSRRLKK